MSTAIVEQFMLPVHSRSLGSSAHSALPIVLLSVFQHKQSRCSERSKFVSWAATKSQIKQCQCIWCEQLSGWTAVQCLLSQWGQKGLVLKGLISLSNKCTFLQVKKCTLFFFVFSGACRALHMQTLSKAICSYFPYSYWEAGRIKTKKCLPALSKFIEN